MPATLDYMQAMPGSRQAKKENTLVTDHMNHSSDHDHKFHLQVNNLD